MLRVSIRCLLSDVNAPYITWGQWNIVNPNADDMDAINPDTNIPYVDNPDTNNPDIDNADITKSDVYHPDTNNPNVDNPDIIKPNVDHPDTNIPDVHHSEALEARHNFSIMIQISKSGIKSKLCMEILLDNMEILNRSTVTSSLIDIINDKRKYN